MAKEKNLEGHFDSEGYFVPANPLQILTDEQMKMLRPLTDEMIEAALERGRKKREEARKYSGYQPPKRDLYFR